MMKVLLTVGVYLSLVLVLGFVLALTASRQGLQHDVGDDES
jgi:hypothetical protein